MDYALPQLRTKFGERAFTHAGPAIWNVLPYNIRTVADPVDVRKLSKSYYFRILSVFVEVFELSLVFFISLF